MNPESEAVKWSGKLPVLRIGELGLCASSWIAPLGLWAICGLLFFAVGFLADLTAFPQGSLWRERPHPARTPHLLTNGGESPRRGLIVRHRLRRLTSSRATPADKKGG